MKQNLTNQNYNYKIMTQDITLRLVYLISHMMEGMFKNALKFNQDIGD